MEYGGVSMPNVDIQNESVKIAWVKRLLARPQNNWA